MFLKHLAQLNRVNYPTRQPLWKTQFLFAKVPPKKLSEFYWRLQNPVSPGWDSTANWGPQVQPAHLRSISHCNPTVPWEHQRGIYLPDLSHGTKQNLKAPFFASFNHGGYRRWPGQALESLIKQWKVEVPGVLEPYRIINSASRWWQVE